MLTSPIGIPTRWVTGVLSALFVVTWSSGFIGAKLIGPEVPVTTVLMWRFITVTTLLVTILGACSPRALRTGRGYGRQVLIGALSQTGYTVTIYWAVSLGVSTGTTALIDGVQPLVVAALAGTVLGAATSRRQWFGLAAGAIGVVIVTWTDATSSAGHVPWWGYLVPLIGMACLVAATLLDRRSADTMSPMMTLTVHCATSAGIFTIACVATGTAKPPMQEHFWLAIAWLVLLSTIGGYGLYWVLLRRSGVTAVNTLMFLIPPVTALWGSAMYGETFTWTTALGLSMALGATWIVNRHGLSDDDRKYSSGSTRRAEVPVTTFAARKRPSAVVRR